MVTPIICLLISSSILLQKELLPRPSSAYEESDIFLFVVPPSGIGGVAVYGFLLCKVRYRWQDTYTNKAFLRLFASALCLMGLLQISVQLTLSYELFLLQGGVWMLFIFGLTWYELCDRLWVRRTNKNIEQ